MKVIIMVIVLAFIVVMVIFTMALARTAAQRTDQEQMLEDRDQREYLSAWHSRKRSRVNVPDISSDRIVHSVESPENPKKNEKGRGLSGPKELLMSYAAGVPREI